MYNDHLSYKRVLAVLQYMVWLYLIKHLYFIVNYIKMTLTSRPAKLQEVRPVYNTPEMRSVGSVFSSCPQCEPKHTNSKHWDCRFVYLVFFLLPCFGSLLSCGVPDLLWLFLHMTAAAAAATPVTETRAGSPRGFCKSVPLVQFQMHADICDALLHCMTTRGVLLQI